jgi:hypothetical protein
MHNREISRQLQRLKNLFKKVDSACGNDIEMRSHWAKYLCVIAAGLIENALHEIFTDFANSGSSEHIRGYVSASLRKIQNPKTVRFLEVTKSFKKDWHDQLTDYVALEGRREAIDSIMQNRHDIAHGKDSDITIARVKEYLEKAEDVLEYLEGLCRGE